MTTEIDDEYIIENDDELINIDGITPETESKEENQSEKKDDEKEEKEAYSRRVQKRLDKLVYERNVEREERQKEKAERERITQELKAEIEELKRSRQKEEEERSNQSIDQRRQELIQRKKDALEIDDHDEIILIDDELMELKLKARLQAEKAPEPKQQPTTVRQEQAPPPPVQEAQPAPNVPEIPEAQRVWEQNNPWLFDANQKSRLEKANTLFHSLIQDGYEADDPDTFVQLDKLLKRESPPPTAPPDRGNVVGKDKSTAFTQEDRKKMLAWNLDPNDARQRAAWIKNRLTSG